MMDAMCVQSHVLCVYQIAQKLHKTLPLCMKYQSQLIHLNLLKE